MPWRGPEYEGDFPTLGYGVAEFIEKKCAIPDGDLMGDPFLLTDEMLAFLAWHYRVDESGKFVYRRSQLVRPQKWGKGPFSAAMICAEAEGPVLFAGWDAQGEPVGRPWATPWIQVTAVSEDQPLALDTAVATPTGWTTVGDLEVGDLVFSEAGTPAEIRRCTDVLLGEPCYRVTFDDGESVVASGRHGWTLDRLNGHADRHETVTVTTEELAGSYRGPKGRKRYRTSGTTWQLPEAKLEVDPYLLGLWLGDGATNDATIAIDWRDRHEMEAIVGPLLEGHETITWHNAPGTNTGLMRIRKRPMLCRWGHDYTTDHVPSGPLHVTCGPCKRGARGEGPRLFTFREKLRDIGVLGNKHIPAAYLRSSEDQRRSLLQGLIDSDGSLDAKGMASFCNTNETLIDQAAELLTSLGYKWRKVRSVAAWRLFFTAGDNRPPCRLSRKLARQRSWGQRATSRYRYVETVEPVASVPVRCVGIDTAAHLFLVGRRCVPTHNTENVYRALLPMIQLGSIAGEITDTGITRINLPGGGLIEPVTASARSRLGQRITFSVMDESHSWLKENGGQKLADTQRRNLAGMGGRSIETTNAWDPNEGSVAQVTYESKVADVYKDFPDSLKGSITDKRERKRVLKGAYRDSWWVDLDRIDAEVLELLTRDPAQAERFYCNRIVTGSDHAFDIELWNTLADPKVIPEKSLIVCGFDGSRFDDSTALIATHVETGHQWPLGVWEPVDGEIPFDEVDEALEQAFTLFDVWRVYADPPYWDDRIDAWAGRWGEQRVVRWWTNQRKKMAYALQSWQTAMITRELTHSGDPVLTEHVGNARRRQHQQLRDERGASMWTIQKDRPGSAYKIDAAVAACLSWEARGDAIAAGALNKTGRKKGAVGF